MESHLLSHAIRAHAYLSNFSLQQFQIRQHSTLTNDSNISAMVTVLLPHTTTTALCYIGFSPSTIEASKNWSTPLSEVSCNCPYKNTMVFKILLRIIAVHFMKKLHSPTTYTWCIPNDLSSCLHTTIASSLPNPLSHTVPQNSSTQISTLPSLSLLPSTRRRSPELHSDWEVVLP